MESRPLWRGGPGCAACITRLRTASSCAGGPRGLGVDPPIRPSRPTLLSHPMRPPQRRHRVFPVHSRNGCGGGLEPYDPLHCGVSEPDRPQHGVACPLIPLGVIPSGATRSRFSSAGSLTKSSRRQRRPRGLMVGVSHPPCGGTSSPTMSGAHQIAPPGTRPRPVSAIPMVGLLGVGVISHDHHRWRVVTVSDALQPSTLRCTRRDPHREEGVRVPPSDAGHRPQGVDRVTRSPRRRRSTERPPSRVGAEIGTRHVATAGWGGARGPSPCFRPRLGRASRGFG
jgi:hypothetical protein